MKMKNFLTALPIAALLLGGCVDMSDLDRRVAALEDRLETYDHEVATSDEQLAAMSTSLNELVGLYSELGGYIEDIKVNRNDLAGSLEETNAAIQQLQQKLEGEIDANAGRIRNELGSLTGSVENRLTQMDNRINSLSSRYESIEDEIVRLREYIYQEVQANNRDWVASTFATISELEDLSRDLAGIKGDINTITQSMAQLETNINARIDGDIATLAASLDEELRQELERITSEYTEAIGKASEEITAAYTTAISDAFSSLEDSLTGWVTEQLANYYTKAEADALLKSQQELLEARLKEQKEYLEGLIETLESQEGDNTAKIEELKAMLQSVEEQLAANEEKIAALEEKLDQLALDMDEVYRDLIREAISQYGGEIITDLLEKLDDVDELLNEALNEVYSAINDMSGRIDALESAVADLQQQITDYGAIIDKILQRVQSLVYVPVYTDGAADATYYVNSRGVTVGQSATFDFEIRPKDAAERLASVYSSALSMRAYLPQTRADVNFTILPVSSATANDGILTVVASVAALPNDFFAGYSAVMATLEISSDFDTITSEFIPLTPRRVEAPIENITFEDPIVKAICILYFDSNHDGEISLVEAAAITDIKTVFASSAEWSNQFSSFSEFYYFTGVKHLSSFAFGNQINLKTITLPPSITSIEASVFSGCDALETIYFTSANPPTIDKDSFRGCNTCDLMVPEASFNAYRGNRTWRNYYSDRIKAY